MDHPTPPSRLLVLGVTSLIGRRLVSTLAGTGRPAVALSRGEPPAWRPVGGDVVWRRGDVTDPAWAEGFGPCDAALSLSPIWLLPQALPVMAGLGVRRLAAFSSTSRMTKLSSPVAAEREVAERLAWGETETLRLCAELAIGCTLFRPTLIYAEGEDRNVSRLAALISRLGVLPISGRGEGLRQPVHAADLAWAALAVLDAPQTIGRTYALPGGETLTYRAMVARVFEGLGRRPRILALPPWAWRLGLAIARPSLPGATSAMGSRMDEDLAFDGGPATRDFGWAPRPFRPRFQRSA